ncbi:P-loop containing nucleoside triphosphate hydrolase protein [Ceratobasidium sp. AG-I]|nr:P-loop containing nucleoside triphosphate hydrolase protein [Ceratobasidium sp. AG-I]
MISTHRLGMLAIRSITRRRTSLLSLHTSALLLRAPSPSRARDRTVPERFRGGRRPFPFPRASSAPAKLLDSKQVRASLIRDVDTWTKSRSTLEHAAALGIPKNLAKDWLRIFPLTVRDELNEIDLDNVQAESSQWDLPGIAGDMHEDLRFGTQRAYLSRFLRFAISQLSSSPSSSEATSQKLLKSLLAIRDATDLRHMIEWYPLARSMRRKVIMHVGPTNSGKTYNALQALAGAPSGVYAGPLRLLAHEVWQRINKGSIAPKQGPAEEPAEAEKDEGVIDLDDAKPAVVTTELSPDSPPIVTPVPTIPPSTGYAGRPCNLLTGEEQRIVSPHATAVACTVEMIPKHLIWDVGVIDEIQMLADQHRGGAWTSAVLGLAARELHLCGEDTVVDLVRTMCALTGDEFVVNRYERLTPLEVSPESLGGKLAKVEPGDCVVTFSRGEIFNTKRRIEQATGLRCAVVYGRLPPEVRSEQAQLFNSESSGYDVIVASDSVGMGLNLKIRRVVFMRTEKWDGTKDVPVSIPLIKQIAGRAGRFGLLKSKTKTAGKTVADIAAAQPPGFVSALTDISLEHIKEALNTPNPVIQHARVDIANPNTEELANALAPGTGVTDLLEIMRLIARLPSHMRLAVPNIPLRDESANATKRSDILESMARREDVSSEVDTITRSLPLSERLVFACAPIRWRDDLAKAAGIRFIEAYESRLQVNIQREVRGLELVEALDEVQELRRSWNRKRKYEKNRKLSESHPGAADEDEKLSQLNQTTLQRLESLHSTLVLYMWLSYRLPLGFYQGQEAENMKAEVEKGIEWCLERVRAQQSRKGKKVPREEQSGETEESEKEAPKDQIKYLTRDALERWRSQGATADVWSRLLEKDQRMSG